METKIKPVLGLDTSGSRLKIVLMTPEGKFKKLVKKELNQENLLFPLLDKLLSDCRLKLSDISKICVLRGPGRFTGIRIGLTFARMMNALAGIRVAGLTAFEVLAYQAVHSSDFKLWQSRIHPAGVKGDSKGGLIAVLLHAFKSEYYCQMYKWRNKSTLLRQPAYAEASAGRGYGGQARAQVTAEAVEEPKWMSLEEIKKYLNGFKCNLYCIANMEESPDIYSLAPLNSGKAPSGISKILPENIIMAGRLLTDSNVNPLYLKPAKYELETKKGDRV